jgi:hypothetical protein
MTCPSSTTCTRCREALTFVPGRGWSHAQGGVYRPGLPRLRLARRAISERENLSRLRRQERRRRPLRAARLLEESGADQEAGMMTDDARRRITDALADLNTALVGAIDSQLQVDVARQQDDLGRDAPRISLTFQRDDPLMPDKREVNLAVVAARQLIESDQDAVVEALLELNQWQRQELLRRLAAADHA